jgi:4-hydroxy-tetrahydrodipicolinate reductase
MGQELMQLASSDAQLELCAAVDAPQSPLVGSEVHGVKITSDLDAAMAACDVYIDFTVPEATRKAAQAASRHGTAAVIGTTGLAAEDEAALNELAKSSAVLVAPNFSLGVNLLVHLAEIAARALGPDYDLEVVELHHRRKRDAPSGTALALGRGLAKGRGLDFDQAAKTAREGIVGPRTDDEIGLVAVRGGDIVGEHTAYLISDDERIELTHRADKRRLFAQGALRAARFVAGKAPGTYDMAQVLGLS